MTIDWWTLGIQTVNVLILVWLLKRFFWRPVAGMIAQRRTATQTTLADADAKSARAQAASVKIDETRAGFGAERDAILAAARTDAEQVRTNGRDEARTASAALEAAAAARIEAARAQTEQAWAERASRLAIEIAGRLAARLDGPPVEEAFVSWLLSDVRALPESVRRTVGADGATLTVISAKPLDAAGQEQTRARIADAFEAHPPIAFESDPALIAGLELRGPHFILANSWRADLRRIEADLAHAE